MMEFGADDLLGQGFDSIAYGLFSAHCVVGTIAALLAQHKGYPLGRWLLWGLVGGTATLVVVLRMAPLPPSR